MPSRRGSGVPAVAVHPAPKQGSGKPADLEQGLRQLDDAPPARPVLADPSTGHHPLGAPLHGAGSQSAIEIQCVVVREQRVYVKVGVMQVMVRQRVHLPGFKPAAGRDCSASALASQGPWPRQALFPSSQKCAQCNASLAMTALGAACLGGARDRGSPPHLPCGHSLPGLFCPDHLLEGRAAGAMACAPAPQSRVKCAHLIDFSEKARQRPGSADTNVKGPAPCRLLSSGLRKGASCSSEAAGAAGARSAQDRGLPVSHTGPASWGARLGGWSHAARHNLRACRPTARRAAQQSKTLHMDIPPSLLQAFTDGLPVSAWAQGHEAFPTGPGCGFLGSACGAWP